MSLPAKDENGDLGSWGVEATKEYGQSDPNVG